MNPASSALAEKLALNLGDVIAAKHIAQGYHWNVKGMDFSEFHEFFGDVYADYDGSVDDTAENIRKLGFDAPYLLADFSDLSCIEEARIENGSALSMVESLLRVNAAVLASTSAAFEMANHCNEQGIADFLAGRINMLQKWDWQLKATLGL